MKKIIIVLALLMSGLSLKAQKKKTVEIETTIQCEMCTNRLDKMFADIWAVRKVDYDIEDKMITVQYNSKKISAQKIREKISSVGYKADDVEADPEAYEKLPACCQLGGH